ncbi:MAG: hypothetical protein CMJ85_07390 [Planctomycetes bacterium]|jgi:hypothetical protein|nr:hypothetical protein [Planctomycetota bacterium]
MHGRVVVATTNLSSRFMARLLVLADDGISEVTADVGRNGSAIQFTAPKHLAQASGTVGEHLRLGWRMHDIS